MKLMQLVQIDKYKSADSWPRIFFCLFGVLAQLQTSFHQIDSMVNAGPPPTHVGTLAEAFPKFFQHACIGDPEPFLLFSKLLHCRCVCKHWQHALNEALPTSR